MSCSNIDMEDNWLELLVGVKRGLWSKDMGVDVPDPRRLDEIVGLENENKFATDFCDVEADGPT